jgi:hypothetical protein
MGNFAAVEAANLFAFEPPDCLLLLTRRFNFFPTFCGPSGKWILETQIEWRVIETRKMFPSLLIFVFLYFYQNLRNSLKKRHVLNFTVVSPSFYCALFISSL